MTSHPDTPGLMIRVRGAVQGVGFRPFVFREATRLGIRGWVRNTASGAEILASATTQSIDAFISAIRSAPAPVRVESLDIEPYYNHIAPRDFQIVESLPEGKKTASILPDLATCPDCRREIMDPHNRRYRYPFTNCVACGPRYTIIDRIPYDRPHTTMRGFEMCPACRAEYQDPADRRFHAQPNACPVCGPHIWLCDKSGKTVHARDEALIAAVCLLREGRILAVKGVGGFHLMADAARDDVISELRRRKQREQKPLAVMMPDLQTAHAFCELNRKEEEWLTSPAAPIMLLKKKPHADRLAGSIAPGQSRLGIMLPYTPLHHLLLSEFGNPVVATSGNISDEPICIDNDEALMRLGIIADFFLMHNRPIAHPVDDSVVRMVLDQPLLLRKARGLAPDTIQMDSGIAADPVLGCGAHMKTTLAIAHGNQLTVGPHIGDLSTVPAIAAYTRASSVMQEIHGVHAGAVCCDKHPDYATTHIARKKTSQPHAVQHHVAHILAVMAEHRLTGPVLGVVWDGTGYGDDGTIWGGEFLRVGADGYERLAHLRTFPLPGGDAAAREPRRSAIGILHAMQAMEKANLLSFTPAERRIISTAIARGINTVPTSSAGRLFDAAAALIGICEQSNYEGHAAMLLQAEAERSPHERAHYYTAHQQESRSPVPLDWEPIIRGILEDRRSKTPTAMIAARFHRSLAALIADGASMAPNHPIILCGGCFQNALLLELAVRQLERDGRQVYWPHRLPPNDGAISAGQVYSCLQAMAASPHSVPT